MVAIQSVASGWVDSMVRFTGGGFGINLKGGAMNATTSPTLADDDDGDSLSSVISDLEEEGEVSEPWEEDDSNQNISDMLSEEIAAGSDELSASDELVSAMAKHLEIIEAAMRQHQATGTLKFHDENAKNGANFDENPTRDTFNGALVGDMLQDPAATFAATIPGQDRMGILSLLS
jgi:hypothetical protein